MSTNETNKKFYRRWAEIYIDKYDNEGVDEANEWADRVVPMKESHHVTEEIKYLRAMKPRPQK